MNDARGTILAKVNGLIIEKTMQPRPIQPALKLDAESLLVRFSQKLQAVHASVDRVRSREQLGASIAQFIKTHKLNMEVAVVPLLNIESLSLKQSIKANSCEQMADCKAVITQASWGIAETGSLLLPSSLQRPTLANFLPDNCIVLLHVDNLLPYLEDGLSRVHNSETGMPRALNIISGPSKTADIEQTLVYGAHGPIRLHVIVQDYWL